MTLNEYEREQDRLEYEDERETALADVLYEDEYSPDDPGNYAEAIGEMSDVTWKQIVDAFRSNNGEFAIPILNAAVEDYWWNLALRTVRNERD